MRVRISYGIEVEDIPEQAETIGQDAIYKLREAIDSLSKAIDNIEESENNYTLVLSMLEKTRLKLNKTDLIITDLTAILEGLQNYHNGEEHVSEGRPIMDPSRDTTTEIEDPGEG
tara:strand:- start:3798 stop:4142 length:345 start_codon:yes stop_codon:yes gene_type:complete